MRAVACQACGMTAISKGHRAALGIRCHSGWAAAVVVARAGTTVQVIDRRRIELCDSSVDGSKQPFHAAEAMPFPAAAAFIARCRECTSGVAFDGIQTLALVTSAQGFKLAAAGVLWASGRALPVLREILQSHALIHAAEGLFYRDAIATSCQAAGLPVSRIPESDAFRQARDRAALSQAEIRNRLAAVGKGLGAPWTVDQKLATLAGWIVLP